MIKRQLERLAEWIYDHVIYPRSDIDTEVREVRKLQILTKDRALQIIRKQYVELLCKILLCTLGIGILGAALAVSKNGQKKDDIHLQRESYDGDVLEYELETDASLQEESIVIPVSPRVYTEEEIQTLFQDGFRYVEKHLLGENKDYEHIIKPLDFVDSIPSSPLEIQYFWENEEVLDAEGNVVYDAFSDTVPITVYVVLSYDNEEQEQSVQMVLRQPKYSEKELMIQNIKKEIQALDTKTCHQEELVIPHKINEVSLQLKEDNMDIVWMVIVVFLLPVLLWYQYRQTRKESLGKREENLRNSYPEIVSQLVLYLGAGMTIKGCFVQLAKDYAKQKKRTGEITYFYEECSAMVEELRNGGSERACYEELGKRLELPRYRKLMTLLSQNLTKGSKGLLDLLQQESEQALQLQKDDARKKGEEASTKLLFPMLLLLVVVMIIVMMPAFVGLEL